MKGALNKFPKIFHLHWLRGMCAKLGLTEVRENDQILIDELLQAMKKYRADFTNTFLSLTYDEWSGAVLYHSKEFKEWYEKWEERRKLQKISLNDSQKIMYQHNPAIIPRNHRVEEVLAQVEKENYEPLKKLLDLLSDPYRHTIEQMEYNKDPIPEEPYVTYCGT